MAEIPSDAIQLGRVGYTDKGAYNSATTYNKYNTVSFNGAVWVCKQNNVTGVEPSESTTWHEILQGTTKATADTAGIIKPDNITVKVDNDGVLSIPIADASTAGLVKPDGKTITIEADGTIKGANVDDKLDTDSVDPVQNKVVAKEFKALEGLLNSIITTGKVTVQAVTKSGDDLVTKGGDTLVFTKKIGG